MTTLYHPNMRDTAIEVEDDKVESYVAQGWRKTKPRAKSEPAESTATASASPSGEDNNKEVSE